MSETQPLRFDGHRTVLPGESELPTLGASTSVGRHDVT